MSVGAGFPSVLALDGPVPAWELGHPPGEDRSCAGHDARHGRMHVAVVRTAGAERRTFDRHGTVLSTLRWEPFPDPRGPDRCLPLGEDRVVACRGRLTPGAWIGDPDGRWRPVALPVPCPALVGLVPLPDGGVLVTAERDTGSTQALDLGPDGTVRGHEVWQDNEVTARFRFPGVDVDVHDFDNPWEPSWGARVRPHGGTALQFGRAPLEAEGLLWFDGWLAVFGEDALWGVPVTAPRRSHALLYGPWAQRTVGLALDFRGLDLMPGLTEFRARLAGAVPPPYGQFQLLAHSPVSIQALPDSPRKVRGTRLDSPVPFEWVFEGPPSTEEWKRRIVDGTSAPAAATA